jgi:hypothetical protein
MYEADIVDDIAYIYVASLIVGMLEYWNTGILGSGKMERWVIVKFLLTRIK